MEEEKKIIEISEDEYNDLIAASEFLECLEACGVDNWCGYDDAQEMRDNQE